MDVLRNLSTERGQALADLVSVRPGQVVSMSLTRAGKAQITLFAFAAGERVREAQYLGDTLYEVIEGEMPLDTPDGKATLRAGECIAVPAGVPHAIGGAGPFKLLQVTVEP